MTSNHDEPRISADDERFVQKLAALYRPPEATAAARARFAARLDERIARGHGRRPWLLGGALAAAACALILALFTGGESGVPVVNDAGHDAAGRPSTEEALLLLANGPLADPDEELPEDYRTLASLLE